MNGTMKKERAKPGLKFPEIQKDVYQAVRQHCFDNEITPAALARRMGVQKSRFSELKAVDQNGAWKFPLSEGFLNKLIWGDVVEFDKIKDKIDTGDEKKRQWLRRHERMKKLELLDSRNYPIDEALDEMIRRSEKNANIIKVNR